MGTIKNEVIVQKGTAKTSPEPPFKGGIVKSPPLKGDLGGCKAFAIDPVNYYKMSR